MKKISHLQSLAGYGGRTGWSAGVGGLVLGLWLLGVAAPAGAVVVENGFERYRGILERKPFGSGPSAADLAAQAQVPAGDSFAKTLRLSGLIEQDDGSLEVGLVDSNGNKYYLLRVGEGVDGMEVVSANYENQEAVLRKGAETVTIKLQSGEVKAPGAAGAPNLGISAPPMMPPNVPSGPTVPVVPRLSYAERRAARLQQMQAAAQSLQPRITGEKLEKHLQQYQMQVIREGLPPLPIPLTPEMDKQLVKEGVLPPQR